MKLIQGMLISLIAVAGLNANAMLTKDQAGREMTVICANENYVVRVYAPNAAYPQTSMAVNDSKPGIMALVSNEVVRPVMLDNGIVYNGERAALKVVGDSKMLKGYLKIGVQIPENVQELVCEQRSYIMPITQTM